MAGASERAEHEVGEADGTEKEHEAAADQADGEASVTEFYDGLIKGLIEIPHNGGNDRHTLCGLQRYITRMCGGAKTREESGQGEACADRYIPCMSFGVVDNTHDLRGLQRHITRLCGEWEVNEA